LPIIFARSVISGAGTLPQIVQFPDRPHYVVQVHRVTSFISSHSLATAVGTIFDHNISLAITIQINDFPSTWCRIDQAVTDSPPSGVQEYDPAPLELAGPQRLILVNSAGVITVITTVVYSLRFERSIDKWNELRARTSFERG